MIRRDLFQISLFDGNFDCRKSPIRRVSDGFFRDQKNSSVPFFSHFPRLYLFIYLSVSRLNRSHVHFELFRSPDEMIDSHKRYTTSASIFRLPSPGHRSGRPGLFLFIISRFIRSDFFSVVAFSTSFYFSRAIFPRPNMKWFINIETRKRKAVRLSGTREI